MSDTVIIVVTTKCREIIDVAGDVTAVLATAPPGKLAELRAAAPWLCGELQRLVDAVHDLDHLTAFLELPGVTSPGLFPAVTASQL